MGGHSPLLTLITKAIDTTSISYQPLSVFMLREGRHLQFFVYKKRSQVFCLQKTVSSFLFTKNGDFSNYNWILLNY